LNAAFIALLVPSTHLTRPFCYYYTGLYEPPQQQPKQQFPYGQIKSITGNNPKRGLLSRPHVITIHHYKTAADDSTGTTTTNSRSSTDIGVFVFAGMKEQDEFVALVEDRKQQHQHQQQRGGPEAAWLV
jgi:hypothetical protein